MYQNPKSATTAGLLGIFLGAFGAHNWYLGEKGKGIAHVCMMGSGLLLEIVAAAILPNVLSISALITGASIIGVLGIVASVAMSASGIWGLVEGITILAQGDAGLARRGYAVAAPAVPQGYPANGQYGYGPQPMQPMQPMQPQQPYYGQPMPQPMPPMGQPMQPTMPQQPDQSMNQQPSMEQPQQPEQPVENTNNGQ